MFNSCPATIWKSGTEGKAWASQMKCREKSKEETVWFKMAREPGCLPACFSCQLSIAKEKQLHYSKCLRGCFLSLVWKYVLFSLLKISSLTITRYASSWENRLACPGRPTANSTLGASWRLFSLIIPWVYVPLSSSSGWDSYFLY